MFCNLQDAAKHQKSKSGSTPLTTKTTATVTPHYKLNMRPTAKFHPISLSSPSRHQDKQRLFEGLEDSMGGVGGETFVPRHKSIKKLNIKPKPTQVHVLSVVGCCQLASTSNSSWPAVLVSRLGQLSLFPDWASCPCFWTWHAAPVSGLGQLSLFQTWPAVIVSD